MKSLTNLNKSYFRALVWLVCGLALGGMSSCDRLTDLQGKAMDLFENVSEKTESGMSSVDEKEAKAIIADESRLVLVEFYSDT